MDGTLTVNINCAMHMLFVTFYTRSRHFNETDVTEREPSSETDGEELEEDDCKETDVTEREPCSETDGEELEEDDCKETEDLRSGINIEHCQNEEQAASHIRSDLVSNAVNVATAIDKVRKISRIIRMSPVKNDTLQSYVKSENRKSIHLLLYCMTRWNSLVAMLERYLDVRSPVEKALIDYKINNPLSEAEYASLAAIVHALKSIQLGSEKL